MSWWHDDYDDLYDDYDDYTLADYEIPSTALTIEGPIRAISRRGDIGREWWGRQWVMAMEELAGEGRLQRGKSYARNGSVLRMHISEGIVYADIQGHRMTPYRTAIELRTFSDEEWTTVLDVLSSQALYVAKLLAGEMPQDIAAVFEEQGLSLFPANRRDIGFECSCPDWGNPCKHAAALYYLVAEQLDSDPLILFHLRGRRRESVLQTLNRSNGQSDKTAQNSPSVALEANNFWRKGLTPMVRQRPTPQDVPFALRQLGTPPTVEAKDMRKLYAGVTADALQWLGLT